MNNPRLIPRDLFGMIWYDLGSATTDGRVLQRGLMADLAYLPIDLVIAK